MANHVANRTSALLLGASIVGVVAVLILRRRRASRFTRARVSYTRQPSPGKVAGRVVDKELWSRLKPAFAVQPIETASIEILQDFDEPCEVDVCDCRKLRCAPTLKSHGFTMMSASSAIVGWERNASNAAVACHEAVEVVRQAFGGCEHVFAFDHTWRSSRRSNFDSSKGPGGRAANLSSAVGRVHTDNTPTTARLKIAELVEKGVVPDFAADTARFRAAIVNVWRAYGVGEKVRQFPLGFIKHDTVEAAECFPYTLAFGESCGINGSIEYREGHAWHYYEGMTPEEVLVFVIYEEPPGSGSSSHVMDDAGHEAVDEARRRCKQVYHAALELQGDERPSAEVAERLSVEVRTLVLLPYE